jgi:hypothetical protein
MIKQLLYVLGCGWLILRKPEPPRKSYPLPVYLCAEPACARARQYRWN